MDLTARTDGEPLEGSPIQDEVLVGVREEQSDRGVLVSGQECGPAQRERWRPEDEDGDEERSGSTR